MKRYYTDLLVVLLAVGMLGCAEQAKEQTEEPAEHPGLAVYVQYCASCHNAGVAEAPKLGDPKKWRHRIAKGREALLASTINGIPPGMPIKGLCMSCSDEELDAAIDYMLDAVDNAN